MSNDRKNTDYNRLYEQKRRQESSRKKRMMKNLRKIVRRTAGKMAAETGIDARLAWSAIRIAILRIENRLSYRTMATHPDANPDDLRPHRLRSSGFASGCVAILLSYLRFCSQGRQ